MRFPYACQKLPLHSFLLLTLVASVFTGCGKESISDSVTRQKDRERENASVVGSEYDTVGGAYAGAFQSSNTKSRSGRDDYQVAANLKTIRVPKDGNILPQPVISGSFILTNNSRRMRDGQPMKTVFSFTNGSYDSATRQLSVVISSVQGTPAIVVNCKKDAAEAPNFHCVWLSLISDVRIEFDLARTGDAL